LIRARGKATIEVSRFNRKCPGHRAGLFVCEEQPILEEKGRHMRKEFLITKLGEAFMTADKTGVGIKAQAVPTTQFTSWGKLEEHFLEMGATQDILNNARKQVETNGTAMLLI
jgi:hypothetical protein